MQRVVDLTEPPVLRRHYLVPCVRASLREGDSEWVPVIGPKHPDPDIGVPEEHYHYDFRFIGGALFRRLFRSGGTSFRHRPIPFLLGVVQMTTAIDGDPEERPVRCVRKMPVFPAPRPTGGTMAQFERRYVGRRLRPGCLVCPHRGMPLASLPVDEDGTVICPLHGLAINLARGVVVKRAPR